jgi:predicted dehydrogenase
MHTPIGVAIIGPGKVAHTHAQAVAALPHAELVAVCGRDPERTAAFAAQYGARPYTDLAATLRDPRVQAALICTPHPQHAAQAVAAAEAGVHVLVEKPLAVTTAECDAMLAAAARGGVRLGVISQRRMLQPVQRLKAAIEAGKLGAPILATLTVLGWRSPEYYAMDPWRGTWSGEGGGVLVNQAVHQLDLFQWLMGPVAEVFGYWANLNHPTIEVEDSAVAVVRFRSGALGAVVASNSQNPGLHCTVHVHGSNGASAGVQTEGGSMFISGVTSVVEPAFNDIWTVPGEAELLAGWQAADRAFAATIEPTSYYHQLQIADFLAAVAEGREPLIPGDEGRKAVALFEAIYAAQRTGRPVRFDEGG